jgi:hypothetical protein
LPGLLGLKRSPGPRLSDTSAFCLELIGEIQRSAQRWIPLDQVLSSDDVTSFIVRVQLAA